MCEICFRIACEGAGMGRVKVNKTGQELTIDKTEWWGHGCALYYYLYFPIYQKIFTI